MSLNLRISMEKTEVFPLSNHFYSQFATPLQNTPPPLPEFLNVSCLAKTLSPFNNSYFFFRQPVKLVNQLVYLVFHIGDVGRWVLLFY